MGFGISYGASINNEEVSTLTDTSAIITWTTDTLSDTKVYAGIGFVDTTAPKYSSSESTNYHYAVIGNLAPNTTYKYYIQSGSTSTATQEKAFTTLAAPSGTYLFSFAAISDTQYANGKADTGGARGRPYSKSSQILDAMVQSINQNQTPHAFTIIKGDIIETGYGDQIASQVKGKLDNLTKASDISYKYFPIPGNHDKLSAYSVGNWVTSNMGLLYTPMAATNPTVNSDFNYSFIYNGCRFIMLDSMRTTDSKASIEAGYLSAQLAAAQTAGQKCFIFVHHPVTNVRSEGIPDDVIKEVTGGTVDYDKIQIMNTLEVQSLISSYQNIIAGVFSGHIHDNKYAEIAGVPCVRTSAGIQFPTSYHIYKVYSNGFIQSTYKVPYWTEIARELLTPEAGYSGVYWQQFGLGPNNARNFSHTIGGAAPEVDLTRSSPINGGTNVPLNESIFISFTKPMDSSSVVGSITSSPPLSGTVYSWHNGNTILKIEHGPLAASGTYIITIGTGAKDASGQAMTQSYAITFTTGTQIDSTPPVAAFDRLSNDVSTDNQPTFTGIATDAASAVISIECMADNSGNWSPAAPLDGLFNSKTETFIWSCPTVLTRTVLSHEVAVRCRDAAGNINTSYTTYDFYVIGDRPEIGLQSLGTKIINGDSISKDPSFAVTIISNRTPLTASSYLKNQATAQTTSQTLTLTSIGGNPYLMYGTYSPVLSDGKYAIKIEAVDSMGGTSSKEVIDLLVGTTGDLMAQGSPLNYPNPFNPETSSTTMSYTLSRSSDITLAIYDLVGNQVSRKNFTSGSAGGKAGYNEVTWNGRDDAGNLAGNGIYIYLIIGDGKALAKGKATVLK